MQNHHRLRVYSAAQRLGREVYSLTPLLPARERYALADQLQRAAVSISSNIVEGCGRSTPRDFCSFLDRALGSAKEVASQLEHATAVSLLPRDKASRAITTSITVQRMLASLIRQVRRPGGGPTGHPHD